MQLKSYALHRSSMLVNGMQLDKEKCFSVYFDGTGIKHCVIGQVKKYAEQIAYMNAATTILVFSIAFTSDLLLFWRQFIV